MGTIEGVRTRRHDPLLLNVDTPLSETYFPVGFRVHIATNSRDVLEAAEESWGHFGPEFACEPVQFRVLVQPQGGLASAPVHRMRGHLYSVVSDADNFAVLDMQSLFASFFVSATTAADHKWLRWYFIESMAYMLLAQRYVVPVHAACIARNGAGTLLSGAAGAGKSTLSFACARAGWTFVTDDCTFLLADSDDRTAIGKPYQARFRENASELFPELEGYIARERPNGKISVEVPLGEFPDIRTALRCPITRMVFLDRRSGAAPRLDAVRSDEAIERMLYDMPSYGETVDAIHERTVRKVLEVPAYRLTYASLDDAIDLLSRE